MVGANQTLSPFVATGNGAAFSPDGRFVAFTSPESGRAEVSVTTFPERRQTWPITTEGGYVVSWSIDGKELLVATLTGHIVAYPVTAGDTFSAGAPGYRAERRLRREIRARYAGSLAPLDSGAQGPRQGSG